jgi:hypothetical protein
VNLIGRNLGDWFSSEVVSYGCRSYRTDNSNATAFAERR